MSDKPINVFQQMILLALNNPRLGKHIFSGTVKPEEIARRRKASKVARVQRRKNRK